MYPYPIDLPADEIKIVLNLLRGQPGKLADDIHAFWVVAGYALSKAEPVGAPTAMALSHMDQAIHDRAVHELELGLGGAHHINWQVVLPVVLNIIQFVVKNANLIPIQSAPAPVPVIGASDAA